MQVQVLRLFGKATVAPRRSHKAADTSACFHRVLPALLAAAAAPDRAVRAAALDAVQALSASVKAGSSHAEGTLTGMPSCRHIESAMAVLQMPGSQTCRGSCVGKYSIFSLIEGCRYRRRLVPRPLRTEHNGREPGLLTLATGDWDDQ